MSFEDKYVVSKRGQPAGTFTAREIIDLLRMKELSTIHKVKVEDEEMTVAAFIEIYESGGLPEQNLGQPPVEEKKKEEPEEEEVVEEEQVEAPPPPADLPPPEPGPADEIHVSREGQRFGPYLVNEVKDYLKAGNLRFSDLVWYDGVVEWVPLSRVPGVGEGVETLHAAAPPPPKPPPPPAGPPQPPPVAASGPPQAAVAIQQPVFGGGDEMGDDAESLEDERVDVASLGARALALFVDTLLIALVTSVPVGLAYLLGGKAVEDASTEELIGGILLIFAIVGWLYSSLAESSAGMATLGKRMVKAQVCVEETGGRMGFGLASARAFSKIAGVIGFFFIFISRRRQTLHDMLAGTIVRRCIDDAFEEDFDDDEYEENEE